MEEYKPRILDLMLARKLQSKGAVLIEGPKWCGKTTTASEFANTQVKLANPTIRKNFQALLEINTDEALKGTTPVLFDEWQTVPKLWDAVRSEVDSRHKFGQFILTGSAVPNREAEKEIEHSGTGRFAWLKMRPMTILESGDAKGGVSLGKLFGPTDKIFVKNELDLKDIAFLICRGGWPMSIDLPREAALEQAFDYYDAVTKEDITRSDGVKRASAKVQRLMRVYARNQGCQISIERLRADLKENESSALDDKSMSSYIDALKKIFVIEDMEAWNPNLRSKTAVRSADTRYFIDPSIATASLGLGPEDLTQDLNTMGMLFETLCVRDLRVYAEALNGKVYHYRDKSGLECDAVVHLRNGHYGLIEIKLGGETLIKHGADTLNALADKIDTSKMKSPSFKMILTAVGDYAYQRTEDGIYVVPIGCLEL